MTTSISPEPQALPSSPTRDEQPHGPDSFPAAQSPTAQAAASPTAAAPVSPPVEPAAGLRSPQELTTNAADTEPINPEIAPLHAMFPDFDPIVLQSVLESAGGDQDTAIDILLGMNDPDYVSQEPQRAEPSQTDLDAELARRLYLEDAQLQGHAQQWDPRQQQQQQPVPYQARQGHPPQGQGHWGDASGGQTGNRDTITEVQEQFSKFAETGKKTFSSLVTKVKAKMQELDQSRTAQNTNPQASQSSWGGGSVSGQAPNSQQPYYDPRAGGYNSAGAVSVQGYDVGSYQDPSRAQHPPTIPARPTEGTTGDVQRSPSPPEALQRPPSTSTGPPPNIDPSKIGMLPKRPVSLLGSSQQSSRDRSRNSDEDELDYVENPFEEGRR